MCGQCYFFFSARSLQAEHPPQEAQSHPQEDFPFFLRTIAPMTTSATNATAATMTMISIGCIYASSPSFFTLCAAGLLLFQSTMIAIATANAAA